MRRRIYWNLKKAIGLNNKSTTDWYDKNKFNKILSTIDSNKFNHKNKIGKFKFNNINNLVNNIKNNTISEADAKKKINKLNEIKKAEIKGKCLINGQKMLLNLFDDLVETIFNNNKIVKEDNNKIVKEDNIKIVKEDNNSTVKEDDNKIVKEDNNKIVKENNKIVKEDNSKIVKEDNNANDNDDDNDGNDDNDDDDTAVKEIIILKRSMKQNHFKTK